jgi:regulatory protein
VAEQPTAVDVALRALGRRDLSAHEIEERLRAKGFTEIELGEALETLGRTGLVDDSHFAEQRAASLAARGSGDAAIRHALRRAGVAPELVTLALESLEPERERARAIAEKRGGGQQTARYLSGKGFSDDAIASVVAAATAEEIG